MIGEVFAVYDSKARSFAQPFFSISIETAMRMFKDICEDQNSFLFKHAEDFSLFHLGSFDDDTGQFQNLKAPVSLGLAISYGNTPRS